MTARTKIRAGGLSVKKDCILKRDLRPGGAYALTVPAGLDARAGMW